MEVRIRSTERDCLIHHHHEPSWKIWNSIEMEFFFSRIPLCWKCTSSQTLSATLLLFRGVLWSKIIGVFCVFSRAQQGCLRWNNLIFHAQGICFRSSVQNKKAPPPPQQHIFYQHIISWQIEFNIIFFTSSPIHLVAKNILHEACRISKNIKNGWKLTKLWPIKVWWLSSPSQCQALIG